MGKKSKRSNRRDRSSGHGSNIPTILRRLIQLQKEAAESYNNSLYSKASHMYKECIEIMQQQQDGVLINTGSIESLEFDTSVVELKAALHTNLMRVEYSRCRFDKVVQIYNDIQMSVEREKNFSLSFMCILQGRLAMLRLHASNENKEGVVSLIDTRISEGMNDPMEVMKALQVVMILRNVKEYDAAIALGEKLGRINENRDIATSENSIRQHYLIRDIRDIRDITTLENAISCLERYRTEYHSQTGKVSHNNNLDRVLQAFKKIDDVPKEALVPRLDAYFMMMAQKNYLCHHVDDEELSLQLCSNAIKYLRGYLEKVWRFERHCFTCNQAGTATEVQLVCSGCRVACYCSLDHQRLTWKKDAIQGMRIGHEILCPLMKAYRKWKLVKKKDNERSTKLRIRFFRECEYFLYHGLGLKDKCFREEDVQKYFSLQNKSE